jgi:branched-chain amino acid transport system substrate-binding protein
MKTTIILTILALLLSACVQVEEAKPFKFGVVVPLTGPNAEYGEFTRYGVDLAVEDLNSAGGINGRNVQVIYEDTGGDKTKATTAAQKLVNVDGVDALISMTTTMGGAVAPVAEEYKVPHIFGSAAPSLTVNKTFSFRDYPDAAVMCGMLMKQALKDGHEKVAIFGTNAEFTILCHEGAKKTAPVAAYETYSFGDTDFKTQFTKIKQSGSTALITSAFVSDCVHAFKQLKELDLQMQLYVAYQSFTCGTDAHSKTYADILKDAYGADVSLDENGPDYISFRNRLEERGWTIQIRGSALSYDFVKEIAKAYEGCQDTACAANNLRNLKIKGVSGTVSYGGDQNVEREVMLTHYENGEWRKVQ